MGDSIVAGKSKAFAVKIVELYKTLTTAKREYILSQQILRSGTSIGANIHEGLAAVSTADYIYKLQTSLKEARETEYWLDLLHTTNYISDEQFFELNNDNIEIIKLLSSIIKTSKAHKL